MAGKLFNRYLWLYDLIRRRGPIPFSEIRNEWARSEENDNKRKLLPLKTFHNHCMRIAELIGVEVECQKGGNYGYYIGEPPEADRYKMDIIDHMLMLMAFKDKTSEKVINMDQRNHPNLMPFVNYIAEKKIISFKTFCIPDDKVYSVGRREDFDWIFDFGEMKKQQVDGFLPLALAQVDFCWFLFGVFPDNIDEENPVRVFTLDRLRVLSHDDGSDIDFPFDVRKYLSQDEKTLGLSNDDHSKYLIRRFNNAKMRKRMGMGHKLKSVFGDEIIET